MRLIYLSAIFFLISFIAKPQHYEYIPTDLSEQLWYENQLLRNEGAVGHTSVRPYRRSNLDTLGITKNSLDTSLSEFKERWIGRKLFSESFIALSGKDYKLSINPVMEIDMGADRYAPYKRTYINSRGVWIEGELGDKVTFRSTIFETQARFPYYFNQHISAQRRIPGWTGGLLKGFKEQGYDYARANGEVSYSPNKMFNFSVGHGNHFLGEGYRSLFLSDNALAYPFFRIETTFGPFKYMNMWSQMNDSRYLIDPIDSSQVTGIYAKKYLSMHYLSWDINKRLNVSLFEAIMWGDDFNRFGFDVNFLNPIILYRSVEYNTGFIGGNVLVGAAASYHLPVGIKMYGQMVIDEFTFSAVRKWSEKSWLNMFGWQLGMKWGDAFGVKNWFLLAEYNVVRPHVYSHRSPITNYGHFNIPLAHPWGANFHEIQFRNQYRFRKWWFDANLMYGIVGKDGPEQNWGSNIGANFNVREQTTGVEVAQGVKTSILFADIRVAYLINPVTNLRVEIGYQPRVVKSASPELYDPIASSHIHFGIKTWLFSRYRDF